MAFAWRWQRSEGECLPQEAFLPLRNAFSSQSCWHMCVCVCVYAYVYVCVCIYIFRRASPYIHIYIYIYIYNTEEDCPNPTGRPHPPPPHSLSPHQSVTPPLPLPLPLQLPYPPCPLSAVSCYLSVCLSLSRETFAACGCLRVNLYSICQQKGCWVRGALSKKKKSSGLCG
jgi:hypothetical protein